MTDSNVAQATLEAAQHAIEQEALDMGVARYRKERAKDETSTRPGKRLLVEALKPLAGAVAEWVESVTSGRPTPHANLGYFLQDLDPQIVAYVVARRVLNGAVRGESLQTVAFGISSVLEDSVNFDALKEANPRAYRLLQKKISKTANVGYRHVVMRKQQKYAGVRSIKWGRREKASIGLLLIDLMEHNVMLNGAPLFQKALQSGTRAHDSRYRLIATTTCAEWLEESHKRCELLEPVHMPMVVRPLPWSTPRNGGYLSIGMRYSVIKARNRAAYMAELAEYAMPKVYAAVNALQDTEWKINKGVLGVMQQAWDEGMHIGKMPPRDLLPLPPRAAEGCAPEELMRAKAARAHVHGENARLMSKRLSMDARLMLAAKFTPFERLYFPHALDWRGRAYPVASYLHPQADDTGKALLEFAKGVPLGANGAYWLAVHGANCFGVDKVSFDERAQWVTDHTEEIVACALDPLGPRGGLWMTTDESPWRFLAFCFEWAGYTMGGCSEEFVSYQPVSFDGSCNGLQHYSMMLRDEVGGAAVNLVPAEKPSDVYAQVAAGLDVIARRDTKLGTPGANAWPGRVTRKIAKQPTMTMPYGAGQFGYRQQVLDALRKSEQDTGKAHLPVGADPYESAGYLAGAVREALAGVVVKAAQAMDWLQKASRIASEDGLPIRWEAPNGLPVLQDYREMIGERLDTEITGQRVQLMITREGDALDKRKQAQGIAPNFVHSLDAAHMMETVGMALEYGITDFAMVHDSYGAHAGHADTLGRLLREAFVAMYREDVLGRFRDELIAQLSPKLAAKIPPLPTFGTLDVEAVMDSEYFFA